jgi:hypothetical protein
MIPNNNADHHIRLRELLQSIKAGVCLGRFAATKDIQATAYRLEEERWR